FVEPKKKPSIFSLSQWRTPPPCCSLSPLVISFLSAAESTPPLPPYANYTSLTATILSTLGFRDLVAAGAASLSAATPTTIFAPTDSSLLTCPTCCIPLLLQEHSVPGLYPLHFLRTLAFGTKIGTFAANRCLTVTTTSSAAASKEVFING
ncbi:hypothetical protein MIMGU_mgv1a0210682mg, partial [Erythranthe guttata]